jgi:hypothetical protein
MTLSTILKTIIHPTKLSQQETLLSNPTEPEDCGASEINQSTKKDDEMASSF